MYRYVHKNRIAWRGKDPAICRNYGVVYKQQRLQVVWYVEVILERIENRVCK